MIAFLASLLSQPIGLGFFVVLIVIDFYPLRRFAAGRSPAARRAWIDKLPFVAVAAAVGFANLVLLLQSSSPDHKIASADELDLFHRAMRALYVEAYYFWRPWWPIRLSPVYSTLHRFDPLTLPFVISAIGVVGGVVVAWWIRRRFPLGLALTVCHLALLVPVLGLLEEQQYHNDRYSIVVGVLWSILFSVLLVQPKMRTIVRTLMWCASLSVIITLATLSVRQARVWHDSVALFEHMIDAFGDDPYRCDIHRRRGTYHFRHRRIAASMEEYRRALEIDPDYQAAHTELLRACWLLEGNLKGAIDRYRQVLPHPPDDPRAQDRLLAGFVEIDRWLTVRRRQVLASAPNDPAAHHALGSVLASHGRIDEAIEHFAIANRLDPHNPAVRASLDHALAVRAQMTQGRPASRPQDGE